MAGLEHESDFPSDRATILRDIARNGSTDETSIYGYGDMGHNGQSNGLSNSFQDLDDPAALLESLANFEHPPSGNEGPPSNSTDHFASLLQAATTATQAEAAQTGYSRNERSADQPLSSDKSGLSIASGNNKRKRSNQEDEASEPTQNKHQKTSRRSEEEQLARLQEIWPPEEYDDDESENYEYEQTPSVVANARAAGVHSAAALFRKPSSASKKYTRPPMSKLFTSLELSPEQFLHLQAAAKNYMLDEDHPERRDCVGNRTRGDTDMTKLKLFACVKSFLEDDGWGESCFGERAEGSSQRKLKWPSMKNRIVTLVTPLLRRMVTNERQRQYAMQSRKNKVKGGSEDPNSEDGLSKPNGNQKPRGKSRQANSLSPFPEIDPKLNQYHYDVEEPLPSEEDGQVISKFQYSTRFASAFPIKSPDSSEVKYLVNIIKDGQRIKPRFTLSPTTCPGFPSLVQHIQSIMDDGRGTQSIQVLGPAGLIDVRDQSSWIAAIELVKETEWMDGEAKCIVEMEEDGR